MMKKKQTKEQKRAKQAQHRHLRNLTVISEIKTVFKQATAAIAAKKTDLQEKISLACKTLDKAVSLGVIHENFAARKKSRLWARLHKTSAVTAKK